MAQRNTLLGRAHSELDDWMEREHMKGAFALVGALWSRHPAWGDDPLSDQYHENRWAWHQNLGELLNYHGTAHVRTINTAGVARKLLVVTLIHQDPTRLEAVKAVAGGSTAAHEYRQGLQRLRIEAKSAFLTIKAGRLFVNRDNDALFEVLNAASQFYTHVPDPGQPATEEQQVAMGTLEEHLIALLNDYRAIGPVDHDCRHAIAEAGGGEAPKEVFF